MIITNLHQLERALANLPEDSLVLGIVGSSIEHSQSHTFHTYAFQKTGYPGVFLRLQFPPSSFDALMRRLLRPRTPRQKWTIAGLAVTAPYKIAALRWTTHLEKDAGAIGSVNTLRFVPTKRTKRMNVHGSNTDAEAFLKPLRDEKIHFRDYTVGLIGTGGVGRTVGYALTQMERVKKVTVIARESRNAKRLADRLDITSWISIADMLKKKRRFDILINATGVGQKGTSTEEQRIVPAETFDRVEAIAYDLIYGPRTQFLHDAARHKCRIINGQTMFLHQAAEQFRILTGLSTFDERSVFQAMQPHFG